jgi:ABC-type branched-subunit amino acid transport system permease subunit
MALSGYLATSFVYLGIYVLACWAMNLQYGVTGIYNLAFILFQAAGAYTEAVLTLGPSSGNGAFQQYILGYSLPFPVPMLAGAVVGGMLSLIVGLVVLRRLRSDYQAVTMLTLSVMATLLVTSVVPLFNGPAGLSLVPQPLANSFNTSTVAYSWIYGGICAGFCVISYFFVYRITSSPLGRALRTVRENDAAAAALGKNVNALRLFSFVVGGAIAGLSGALLIGYIGAWAPSSWAYTETIVVLTAVIVGGSGNDAGAVLGALLIPVVVVQGSTFIPQFGPSELVPGLQWIVIGLLGLIFVYYWPRGIIPERRRRFPEEIDSAAGVAPAPAGSTAAVLPRGGTDR